MSGGEASIPMILITGGLGAGKTTLLNHLLHETNLRERELCLIINEFGQLGVDGRLVEAGDHPMYELNRGSLFCICIKTDFVKTLREIADEVRPELLVVEATGMAEPRDIQDFIDEPILAARFHIRANVCLVDASNFIRLAPMLRAVRQQAMWADALILNKTDLVSKAELRQLGAVLEGMNPEARLVPTTFGRVPADFLETLNHTIHRGERLSEPPDPVFALSFSHDRPVDRARFQQVISELGEDLLRLKGQVDFGEGPEFTEVAGGRLSFGGTTSITPITHASTAFVAIGWRASQDVFRSAIEAIWG